MGFGIFKKLKDKLKKVKSWLSHALPKAKTIMNQSAPIVKDLFKNEQFNRAFDIANDGIIAADEAINKRNYKPGIDWVNKELKPRLKNRF